MVAIVPAALALTMVSIRSKLMLQEMYLICIKLIIYNDTHTLYFLKPELNYHLYCDPCGDTFPPLISFSTPDRHFASNGELAVGLVLHRGVNCVDCDFFSLWL